MVAKATDTRLDGWEIHRPEDRSGTMTPLVWLGFRSSSHSEQESIAVGVDLFAFLRLGCVLGQTNI